MFELSPVAALFSDPVGLVLTLVLGGLCGWAASKLMGLGGRVGLVGYVVIGIVGAFLAGWLAPLLGISFGGLIGSLIVSTAGAMLLIFLLRTLGFFR
jgi:uncharacterized membrane protein YeaQ/YmgE (transglycosylase-associated protein family)